MDWEHNDNYLIHYGISGQKWGIRRYQNKDGSLTEEGKRRYGFTNVGSEGNSYAVKKLSKDVKKLEKAIDKSDIYKQEAEREKRYKKAATAAAVGLAAATTAFAIDKNHMHTEYEPVRSKPDPLGEAVRLVTTGSAYKLRPRKVVNSPAAGLARASSIAISGGAYAIAAKNALQGAMAAKLTTISGHYKAVKKRNEIYNRMLKKYEGTSYEDMIKEMSKRFRVKNDDV